VRLALPEDPRRRAAVLALLAALAAAACRLPRLHVPPDEYFDEVYHAVSALQYVRGQAPVDWVHPPTSKLLIAAGVWALGYDSLAWRLAPALAGTLLAPVFFLLARRVLATERAAVLATVLLLCDGVYLVQSRIAMTNIFAVLFQVASALFLVIAVREDRLQARAMLLAGLCLGLALSTRWTSLFAAAFLGGVFLLTRRARLLRARELFLGLLCFALIPAALYVLSYLPLMHVRLPQAGLVDWWMVLRRLLEEQKGIWAYHANLKATHPYFSHWYTWPWLFRPTLYFFQLEGATGPVRGILALGNPALWWASVPVTLWALVSGARARDPRRLFSGLGFCALYLPWGVSPRTLNFSHYLFEAIPYACLSLGTLLDRGWDGPGRALARGYVLLAAVLFLFFFPFLTALPIPRELFYYQLGHGSRPWWWFPSWI
jgi:dolichyl-phosphate-mannose--protein O-mannosyl transferase